MNTTGYLGPRPSSRPRIFAHRGLVFKNSIQVADENTLESFELALESGADYLETDLQLSKDGVTVLFHDSNLTRLLGKKASIESLNLSDLKQIRLPHGGSIPTLREALQAFPDAKFNLDFKSRKTESPGIQDINELKAIDRVLVSSFRDSSIKRALLLSPLKIASSAGSSKVLTSYLLARAGVTSALSKSLASVQALQIPTSRYGIDFTHPKFIQAVLAEDKEIHYWTVNDPDDMESLFALGAHGIVTDRTDLARQVFV